MPSHRKVEVKTYSSKKSTRSVDAVNALFAQNLTKRLKSGKKKAKLKIKDLPPRTAEYLTDDSLKVEPNNTFDKILKGKIYNKVKVASFVRINSSESDPSKSRVTVSIHSPIMTRSRNRSKLLITDITDTSAPVEKSSTLDKPVTSSLCIEKANKSDKNNYSNLSYIKLPKLLSETFREKQSIHSSTPSVPLNGKIVVDPISPITKSDSSSSSKLIEKSYEQIRKWEEKFPNLEAGTPKRLLGVETRGRRRKLSTISDEDWKLNIQPKVWLNRKDSKRNSKKTDDVFKGFSEEEQSSSWEEKNQFSLSLSQIYSSLSKKSIRKVTKMRKMRTKKSFSNKVEKKSCTPHKIMTRGRTKVCSKEGEKETFVHSKRSSRFKSTKIDLLLNSSTSSSDKWEENRSLSPQKNDKLLRKSIRSGIDAKNTQTSIEKSTKSCLTVDQEAFDTFMQNCYEKECQKSKKFSIITVGDSEDSYSSPKLKKELDLSTEYVKSPALGLDYVISPRNSSHKSPNSDRSESKIIILENIKLGFNENVINVLQDHSYTAPDSVFPVTETSIIDESRKLSDIVETSIIDEAGRLSDIVETSIIDEAGPSPNVKNRKKMIKLQPGKSYRRTLSLLRRCSIILDPKQVENCENDCPCLKCVVRARRTSRIVPLEEETRRSVSILEEYARRSSYVQQQEEKFIDNLDESIKSLSLNHSRSELLAPTAKDVVLRRCGQTEVLPFEQCYPKSALQNCQKIGEGVYGEVFLYRNQDGGTTVMKIIPIEGDQIVNGEKQKKFEEILSEIVIAMELSNLRNNIKNTTSSFNEVQKVRCTQGKYPDRLIDLWDLYDETRGSENDSPQMFTSDQMYIVLELANGGKDLESFVFQNAQQAYAMFKQTACALAVAESQLKFEHRDLHWGNILLSSVDRKKTLDFCIEGSQIKVETFGVEASIIDYTLSRMEFDGAVIFNDLGLDNELFDADGDYQFDIYRLMRSANGNEWKHFNPYTNVLWLHYVLDKAISAVLHYKNTKSRVHKEYMNKMHQFYEEMLTYPSVLDFVKKNFM